MGRLLGNGTILAAALTCVTQARGMDLTLSPIATETVWTHCRMGTNLAVGRTSAAYETCQKETVAFFDRSGAQINETPPFYDLSITQLSALEDDTFLLTAMDKSRGWGLYVTFEGLTRIDNPGDAAQAKQIVLDPEVANGINGNQFWPVRGPHDTLLLATGSGFKQIDTRGRTLGWDTIPTPATGQEGDVPARNAAYLASLGAFLMPLVHVLPDGDNQWVSSGTTITLVGSTPDADGILPVLASAYTDADLDDGGMMADGTLVLASQSGTIAFFSVK